MIKTDPPRLIATLLASLAWSCGLLACPAEASSATRFVGALEYRFESQDAWQSGHFFEIPHSDEIVQIRANVILPAAREMGPARDEAPETSPGPIGLRVYALATCEVRWDGQDLGAAGVVGASAEQERPGPLRQILHIPDRLATPGEHLLQLRCSMHHRGFEPTLGFWLLQVGPYAELLTQEQSGLAFALVSFSGMVLMGFFALASWWIDRRRAADFWLASFCLASASLAVAESLRALIPYDYPWHIWRLRAVAGLSALVAVLLVVYVVRRFPRAWEGRGPGRGGPGRGGSGRGKDHRGLAFVAAVAAGAVFSLWIFPSWDAKATFVFLLALPAAGLWSFRAARAGRRGALAAGAGIVICTGLLVWRPGLFIDRNLYVAIDLLLLCLLIGHARESDALRREKQGAELAASRLEAELLRRQLQPHFLMNTLTALSEWIEEEPATAVRMIEALAGEMRALHAVSSRQTIPMAEELALCRGHLEIMSLRRGVNYRLETEGVDEHALIPPAVLHTLVENAVTHGGPPVDAAGAVSMRLIEESGEERGGPRRLLIFDAPLGDSSRGHVGEGTGLSYVTARLREAYGDGARFSSGAEDGVWRTRLDLPAEVK